MTTIKTLQNIDHAPFAGLDRVSQHLAYHLHRQKLIASNLANLDTPGYRSRDLDFTEHFTATLHNGETTRSVRYMESDAVRDDEAPDQDGNTVSLETQLAKSTANTTKFEALSEVLTRRLGLLRYAATDGHG